MSKPETPFGYSIFCDDIRLEVGNKTSLIGIYSGVLGFEGSEFPITIPKLCIVVTWCQDTSDEVHPVTLKIIYEKENGEEQPLLEGELAVAGFKNVTRISESASRLTAQAQAVISPITFEAAGSIKVRAYYNSEEFKLGRLHVIQGPIQVVGPDKQAAA